MKRWLAPGCLFAAASLWLVWAWPHLNPASRLGLRYDLDGYIAQARQVAASQGFDLAGWHGYAKAQTLAKNQYVHARMPGDKMGRAFPDAQVLTTFLPPGSGAAARITLRPDGRPLSWKLSGVPPISSGPKDDVAMAHKAMEQMTGDDVSNYTITSDGAPGSDGMSFKWKRNVTSREMPQAGVEVSVKNGAAFQVDTKFTLPDSLGHEFDSFSAVRVTASIVWVLMLLVALAIAVLREGGAATARIVKDGAAVRFGLVLGLISAVGSFIEWDSAVFSVRSAALRTLSILAGAAFMGLFFYLVDAATMLNARLAPDAARGFRLLSTRAAYSRLVAGEMFGGWLAAPLLVSVPLLVSGLMRLPAFEGYEDDAVLARFPVLDGLLSVSTAAVVAVVVLFGVLAPLAARWFRQGRMRNVCIGIFAVTTFAMLDAPFRGSSAANLMSAALAGLATLWLYSRFGMLGAVSSYAFARILTGAGVLLTQPGHSLETSGWGILLGFGILGLVSLGTALRGPEVVPELYGDAGLRGQARSRREELLAEFNVARSAQRRMLPAEPPAIEGYTVAASCEPAREVGGDLYDFLRVSDGRWGIAVADVSGKGVPAALYMTLTKGLLCAAAQDSGDPRWILAAVNRHLKAVTKRKMFVTMAFAVLDPAAKRMDYVRAGHNPVVWRRRAAGETRLLSGGGIGLGIAAPALFGKTLAIETLELSPGDALVFYSDGLTEAMNEELEQFGEDRLMAAVERADGMRAAEARDSILGEVRRFLDGVHAQDDLTIAVLCVNEETGR